MCNATCMPNRCKSHGVNNCVADPDHLFRVMCTKCEYVHDYHQNGTGAAKYLYHRRRTRAAQGLLSVGAPLDAASAAFLCQTSAQCGIISNTNQPHVSFVEGLIPDIDHTAAVRGLKDALFRNPTLTVVSVHRVPRRDNVMDLILADVVLSPGAEYAAGRLADGRRCNLPQFPFHVALGACPRSGGGSEIAATWAEARLKNVVLAMDATRVRVLPPPEGSKKLASPRRGGRQRQQLQEPNRQATFHQKQHFQQNHQQHHRQQHYAVDNGAMTNPEYFVYNAYCSGSSDAETDETDAVSSVSSTEEHDTHFPGLAVDLTFLD